LQHIDNETGCLHGVCISILGLAPEVVAVIVMVRRLLDTVAQDHDPALEEVAIVTEIGVRIKVVGRGAVLIRRGKDALVDTNRDYSQNGLQLQSC
jgi:hypothetical protein